MKPTASQRRATLERIVVTPKALPGFDLAGFQALSTAERRALWASWGEAERLRVAHAVQHAKRGYSDEATIGLTLAALSEKLG